MADVSDSMRQLLDATSGSLGAMFVALLLYPIDIAKTRIQSGLTEARTLSDALQEILAAEGVAGLFRGVGLKAFHATLQVLNHCPCQRYALGRSMFLNP